MLIASFFTSLDLAIFPACYLLLYFIIRTKARRQKNPRIAALYYRAFFFKLICVFTFTLLTQFYFKGGDTGLYYQGTQDLRAAVKDNPDHLWLALKSPKITYKSPLFDYFYYDGYTGDLTYNYMLSQANYTPVKLALIPSYMFANSYLCISLLFGFFALGGAIRLFKTFYHFYPGAYKEIALACLFLPSVCYWSSGLLKDPITFGCIGYITYGVLNILVLKKKIIVSLTLVVLCGLLLYIIKAYILLVLILALVIWQFAEFNKIIENKTLKNIFSLMTLAASIGIGFLLMNYFTSMEAAQQFQMDKIAGNAEYQRKMYADIAQQTGGSDSYFTINTSNPFLMVFGGITATFYRPFIWEVNSPIMLLSFAESAVFLFLTLFFIYKRGPRKFFTIPFSDPRILLCFIFAFVFAIAV
ncbi:MAG TPA: hypothetical protein VMZ03_03675, partial [Chitinophagaceae bacterium]|nr:hypothetical protein [Chitinophagaceae bacterium]